MDINGGNLFHWIAFFSVKVQRTPVVFLLKMNCQDRRWIASLLSHGGHSRPFGQLLQKVMLKHLEIGKDRERYGKMFWKIKVTYCGL